MTVKLSALIRNAAKIHKVPLKKINDVCIAALDALEEQLYHGNIVELDGLVALIPAHSEVDKVNGTALLTLHDLPLRAEKSEALKRRWKQRQETVGITWKSLEQIREWADLDKTHWKNWQAEDAPNAVQRELHTKVSSLAHDAAPSRSKKKVKRIRKKLRNKWF
jgi:hypothetical protein